MKRIIALITFLVLMFAFCSVALAAGGAQLYDYGPISHRYDFGHLAKGSAQYWLSATDNNTSVRFSNTTLSKYQNSCVVTDSGTAMSAKLRVDTGESQPFTIYTAYKTVAHANLRVWNPYYGTSSASPMYTEGHFDMTF